MSNFGIRTQIDYALDNLEPDLMIINATGVNRFEILKDLDNTYNHNKAYDQICFGDFDWDHFDHEHHINYDKTYDPQIWCDSIYTVISQEARRYQHIESDRVSALKDYAYYVFDENIKAVSNILDGDCDFENKNGYYKMKLINSYKSEGTQVAEHLSTAFLEKEGLVPLNRLIFYKSIS